MTVYGIGLGPGKAGLVTVKGKRLPESAAVVCSPGRLLRTVALNHVPEGHIGGLDFPMARDPDEFHRAWKEAATEVAAHADSEGAALVTLGDPDVYLTFDHLRRILGMFHPEVNLEVVPGVSAMAAFTITLGVKIESETGLAPREAANGAAPTDPDHTVLFKVTDTPATREKLTEAGYDVCFGHRLFMKQDKAVVADDPGKLAERGYCTLAYAKRGGVKHDVAAARFGGVESGGSA